jgi:cytochrome c heme-lyase
MGNNASIENSGNQVPPISSSSNSASSSTSSTSINKECPMNQNTKSSMNECPVKGDEKYKNPSQYNVYSQKIDPTNQMPTQANQQPAPGQAVPLSTDRVKSGIPKGGTDEDTWQYPSPQMFWNALVRKGKAEGSNETDMETVVAIHNNMNEKTWMQVMAWEELHSTPESNGKEPKLLRFQGKPHDLSPKARLKLLFGHPAPFDRHDWVVDRGGKEVRYVIDYYHDESQVNADQTPKLTDLNSMKSIQVDVRPALDSVDSILDRLCRMPIHLVNNPNSKYQPPAFFPSSQMKQAETNKVDDLNKKWIEITKNCEALKNKLAECTSQDECSAAAIALQRCTASVVCPEYVKQLDYWMKFKPTNEEKIEESFDKMSDCLETFAIECKQRNTNIAK